MTLVRDKTNIIDLVDHKTELQGVVFIGKHKSDSAVLTIIFQIKTVFKSNAHIQSDESGINEC